MSDTQVGNRDDGIRDLRLEVKGKRAEDGGQKAEVRGQRDLKPETRVRDLRAETGDGYQKAEDRGQIKQKSVNSKEEIGKTISLKLQK